MNIPILRSLGDNSGFARIPFAVVAVTILFLSSTLIGQVSEIYRLKQNRIIEDEIAEFKKISESESAAIEAGAYSAIQNVLPNITGTQALEYSSLNDRFSMKFSNWLECTYPKDLERHTVEIEDHAIIVIEDWMKSIPGGPYDINNVETAIPCYLKISGEVSFKINMTADNGISAFRSHYFEQSISAPLPLIINLFKNFQAQTRGGNTDFAGIVRYIIYTYSQLKVLSGEDCSEGSEDRLISEEEIEVATNIALILEQARIFRTYDKDAAEALGIDKLLRGYITSGEIDSAELYPALTALLNRKIDIGAVISGSIRVYSDEFLYRLYSTFWQASTPDALLQEPVWNWSDIKAKGEGYAEERLRDFLSIFRTWLMLPPYLIPHLGSTSISKITRHATSVDEASKYPVPLPVRGNYDLFSMPITPRWFAAAGHSGLDYPSWPAPDILIDPIDLILGNAEVKEYRSKPYEISYFSTFGLPKTVNYHLVNQSFLKLYTPGNTTVPYFDCLKNILEILSTGIDIDAATSGQAPGMVDEMVGHAKELMKERFPDLNYNTIMAVGNSPNNSGPVLVRAADAYLDSAMNDAVSAFRELARKQEVLSTIPGTGSWYETGFLKIAQNACTPYRLFLDIVDLFYELFWTLKQSSCASAGKLDGNWAWNFPDIYYAPIDTEQVKKVKSEHFNFKRDALKHAYNSVWTIVLVHLVGNKQYFHPDSISPGKYEYARPPIPEVAWFMYGWDKYPWDPSCSNLRLWDDVKKDIKPALDSAFGKKWGIMFEVEPVIKLLNLTSDSRKYGPGFYEFLWMFIGTELLGPKGCRPESTMEQMIKHKNGWLQKMLQSVLPSSLDTYADCQNIIHRTDFSDRDHFGFFEKYSSDGSEELDHYMEVFSLKQDPDSYRTTKGWNVSISRPIFEPRFVTVQEKDSSLSDAPFVTSWAFSISGRIDLSLCTDSRNLVGPYGYAPMAFTESVPIELDISISLFTGWPLAGMNYPMTISVFDLDNDSFVPDLGLSTCTLEVLHAQVIAESVAQKRLHMACAMLSDYPSGILRENLVNQDKNTDFADLIQNFTKQIDEDAFNDLEWKLMDLLGRCSYLGRENIHFSYWGFTRELLLIKNDEIQVESKTICRNDDFSITYSLGKEENWFVVKYRSNILEIKLNITRDLGSGDWNITISGITPEFRFRSNSRDLLDNFFGSLESRTVDANDRTIRIQVETMPVIDLELSSDKVEPPITSCSTTLKEGNLNLSLFLYHIEQGLLNFKEKGRDGLSININYITKIENGRSKHFSISTTGSCSVNDVIELVRALKIQQFTILKFLSGQDGDIFEEIPSSLLLALFSKNIEIENIKISLMEFVTGGALKKALSSSIERFYGTNRILHTSQKSTTESFCLASPNSETDCNEIVYIFS